MEVHLIQSVAGEGVAMATVEAGSMPLKFCLGCKAARYCSRECQVADWKTHKVACKAAQKAKIPTNKK